MPFLWQAMNTTTLLREQFTNTNSVFHAIVDDLTDEEWVARPAPGENMHGYTAWHMPRTQDGMAQSWIRGVAEIAHGDRWAHWRALKRLGIGVGIALDEADEIARTVKRVDVLEYADAVRQEICAWLEQISDADLDQIPNARQHLSTFAEYQTPGFVEEVSDLYDLPAWSVLMRPCIGHIHRHMGELEAVKGVLRRQRMAR